MLFCFIEICHKIQKGSVNISLGVNSVNLGASKGVTFGNGEEKLSQQPMNEGEKKGLSTTKVVTGLAALALLGTAVYYSMRGKAGAAGKAASEAAEKAGEAAGKAVGKAGEDVADSAGKAGKTGESAAETGKGTEKADSVQKPAKKGKANPLSSLRKKSTAAVAGFHADDAKSIERVNKTYDGVVAGLKENLDLSADEAKKLDAYVNNASLQIKELMNSKFEPGSEEAMISQELNNYYIKHSLMTPEIQAKFDFLENLSSDSITKEKLLKILQKW